MIIEMLMSLLYNLLDLVMVIEIPALPESVMGYVNTLFDYMSAGASILANYTPLGYLLTLFGVLVAVDGGIMVYHFVMWVIRKIPVLGVS